ncbi:hypothetical protein R9X47_28815 [Wukongibacter baidiensis]|uniref:MutS-related protein n=1 Tax=Wukongibacter baidiensis TaxID=1723361 RepID=UPI003D7F3DD4
MQIITIVIILILVYFVNIFVQKTNIRKLRARIRGEFGKKPIIAKYNCEKIGYHWSKYTESISNDEKIDDVTWNDLEMDNVFCRINNCNSFVGEQILYSKLHCLPKNNLYRDLFEKKVSFFTSNDKEREEIQLLLCSLGKDDSAYYLPIFMDNLDLNRISGIWRYWTMQILLALSVLPAIVLQDSKLLFITVGVFLINMIIYAIGKIKYEVNLDMLNSIIGVINIGNKIADTSRLSYENEFSDLKKVAVPFKKVSYMISIIQRKKEAAFSGDIVGLIYDYLIGATLWDFVKYDQIIRTVKDRRNEFMELYKMLGEIDMAITISSFRESLPQYCTPIFSEEHELQIKQIYHPLIDEPVCNTVSLDNSCIITGSNASGKSTYIKAIAINVILAQSIHTCMAKQMILPYARVITSMAVRDDLMAGESYYIKEIKYLKRIIQNLSEERLVICVIDEILRGTNTEERIAASASILRFLSKKNCIAIVASHDIELTQILDNLYDNYHFTEQMQEKDIIFDYKIYKGASNSKNAIKLLKYVGFPDEIIAEARNIDVGR